VEKQSRKPHSALTNVAPVRDSATSLYYIIDLGVEIVIDRHYVPANCNLA